MRSIIPMALLGLVVFAFVFSCQKPLEQEQIPGPFGSKLDRARLACTYTTLSGTISSNTTLSASNIYKLSGIVVVSSGITLTIPAGTVIVAEKSTRAALVVERGATLVANGTTTSPIIFTSDQAPSSRAPGDWRGIVLGGQADNNIPTTKEFGINRGGTTFNVGAISATVNNTGTSSSITNVQIHFAGYVTGTDNYASALCLGAVGSATTIENVEITNSLKDGIAFIGGRVDSKHLVLQDNYKNDLFMELGFTGKMQYALLNRKNSSAHDGTTNFSNGLVIQNDGTNSTNTPKTSPILSNLTIIGPEYCNGTGLSSNFRNAVLLTNGAQGYLANMLITGWGQGMVFDQLSTVQNANNGLLKWMHNTFYGFAATSNEYTFTGFTPLSWNNPSGICTDNIDDFIRNTDTDLTCASLGYQRLTSGLGFESSVCGNYCTTAPNFVLGTSSVANASYTNATINIAFFNKSTQKRGAFSTATDWTPSWVDWCPQSTVYCS